MIELRWTSVEPTFEGRPRHLTKLTCGVYVVLQYRDSSIPIRMEGMTITATAPTEWQDVLLEES